MESLEYVKNVATWDSGGGTTLDLVHLKDGSVLAISGEVIVLYANEDELEAGDAIDRPTIIRLPGKA